MLGRLITALAGRSIARHAGGPGGGMTGAAIGAALPTLARRIGPMGMIAAAAGGYAVKKMVDKRRMQQTATNSYRAGTRNYR